LVEEAIAVSSRKQVKQDRQARLAKVRAQQRAAQRKRRIMWFGGGGVVVVAVVVAVVLATASSGSGGSHEVIPPGVAAGTPVVQPAAVTVPNTSGIAGVVAYVTTGWPSASNNGPASKALGHNHVPGPVTYSVTPPVGGDHNATWMNCGVYSQPVPNERAVHNLEHGAIWITYQPSLPQAQVNQLRSFATGQSVVSIQGQSTGSKYMDVTPYPGLPSPIVVTSWGFQLRLTSPTDPRLQQFVDKFRVSPKYSPEYGAPCTGGVGTPLQT
jgi:hypothetical protein